jgi:hypothetical protein
MLTGEKKLFPKSENSLKRLMPKSPLLSPVAGRKNPDMLKQIAKEGHSIQITATPPAFNQFVAEQVHR